MNLLAAKYLALKHINEHLTGWVFAFNNRKRALGVCKYRSRTIELSKFFIVNSPEDEVLQTILHEIAHAIAGHAAGHGWKWRQVARQIGVKDPSRCASANEQHLQALQQTANYICVCPNCGDTYHAHRMGRRMRTCTYRCNKCGQGGLRWQANRC